MEQLTRKKYIKEDVTKEWLYQNGFRFGQMSGNIESGIYAKRFPVYRYGAYTVLECEISIHLNSGAAKIDVYSNNTHNIYPPSYYDEYGDFEPIVSVINRRIEDKLNKLGINDSRV